MSATNIASDAERRVDYDAVPDIAAAGRAADELVAAGVGRVLLYGSLARGKARAGSDIDLVAIYDDLDYSERFDLRFQLKETAEKAAGCSADILVTDAPEWAVRTTVVPNSFEAKISNYAIELVDCGVHAEIDWAKEIGKPDSPVGEIESYLEHLARAVHTLALGLRPSKLEDEELEEDLPERVSRYEDYRFEQAMAAAHFAIACAAKATHVATVGTAPAHSHSITGLLAPQPPEVTKEFKRRAGEHVDLAAIQACAEGVWFCHEYRPAERIEEEVLRAYAQAALSIADFAHANCCEHGMSETALKHFALGLNAATEALDGPVRLRSGDE